MKKRQFYSRNGAFFIDYFKNDKVESTLKLFPLMG